MGGARGRPGAALAGNQKVVGGAGRSPSLIGHSDRSSQAFFYPLPPPPGAALDSGLVRTSPLLLSGVVSEEGHPPFHRAFDLFWLT